MFLQESFVTQSGRIVISYLILCFHPLYKCGNENFFIVDICELFYKLRKIMLIF